MPSQYDQYTANIISYQAAADSNYGQPIVTNPFGDALVDPNYVNVTLRIDPNWPHLAAFQSQGSSLPQFLYKSMTFMFVSLAEGFQENVGVSYATSDVLGRQEQYKTFTGTSNREIQMTFHFLTQSDTPTDGLYDDVNPLSGAQSQGYTGTGGPLRETILPARWIDSLKAPIFDSNTGLSYAPPPLIFSVGDLLTARVILTSSSLQWLPPFDPKTHNPFGAKVACTFTVVRNDSTNNNTNGANQYSSFITYPQ